METRSGTGGVNRCRLYLVTPPALEPEKFAEPLEAALMAGDVASVQLRLKDASDEEVLHAGSDTDADHPKGWCGIHRQ